MSAGAAPRDSLEPRPSAVAGLFYPARADTLAGMVDELVARAPVVFPPPAEGVVFAAPGDPVVFPPPAEGVVFASPGDPAVFPPSAGSDAESLLGVLVPHAGLVYSGLVAAAAWRLLAVPAGGAAPTIVLLGTNHGAAWLHGVGAWDRGPWRTPLGEVAVDRDLTDAVLELGPPFLRDAECHLGEHSLEVQLPFVSRLAEGSSIVALAVGAGTGGRAVNAGERLGRLLAERRAAGGGVVLVISSDMAHYPPARVSEAVTDGLLPSITLLDPEALAAAESGLVRDRSDVSCGMCGIEPTVLGLAALRAMGARRGTVLAAATSADAGGDARRTVGYLAVAFTG